MEPGLNEVKTVEALDEKAWRAHVSAAEAFAGSNLEYCRRQGLSLSQFRKCKRKFGTVALRGRPRKAFVRVETTAESALDKPMESARTERRREVRGLPDPLWMAEFIVALLKFQ